MALTVRLKSVSIYGWWLAINLLVFHTCSSPVECLQTDSTTTVQEPLWSHLIRDQWNSTSFDQSLLPGYLRLDHLRSTEWRNHHSTECHFDLATALTDFGRRQVWATQLFNSWGKLPPTGFISGTLTDLGDYDQCLSRLGESDSVSSSPRKSRQYCLLDFAFPMPPLPEHEHNLHHPTEGIVSEALMAALPHSNGSLYGHLAAHSSILYYAKLRVAICLPQSCTRSDVDDFVRHSLDHFGFEFRQFRCEANDQDSEEGRQRKLDDVQIAAITLLLCLALLTLGGAIYDRRSDRKVASKQSDPSQKTPTSPYQILRWFSPLRNLRTVMNTSTTNEDIACVHCLRVLAILWIVVCHTFCWNSVNMYKSSFSLRSRLSSLALQPLYKVTYAVETFFYLSGLFTAYVTLRANAHRDVRPHFRASLRFVALRYLRLTPQVAVFLLLSTLLPVMFDGPIWTEYIGPIQRRCYRNWWWNLLYVQNLIDPRNMCFPHTWYLAANMQLHWLSLIPITCWLKYSPKVGILATLTVTLVCLLGSSTAIYWNNYAPDYVMTTKTDFVDANEDISVWQAFYYHSCNHALVYFAGFLFGAFLRHRHRSGGVVRYKLSTRTAVWSAILGGYLFVNYNTLSYVTTGHRYRPLVSAVLFPLNRAVWSAMLTAVLWLCVTGNGGTVVGALLHWTAFRPLSTVAYSVYVSHAAVLYAVLGTRRHLLTIDNTVAMVALVAGTVAVTVLVGAGFAVLVDCPTNSLLRWGRVRWLWLDRKHTDDHSSDPSGKSGPTAFEVANLQQSHLNKDCIEPSKSRE